MVCITRPPLWHWLPGCLQRWCRSNWDMPAQPLRSTPMLMCSRTCRMRPLRRWKQCSLRKGMLPLEYLRSALHLHTELGNECRAFSPAQLSMRAVVSRWAFTANATGCTRRRLRERRLPLYLSFARTWHLQETSRRYSAVPPRREPAGSHVAKWDSNNPVLSLEQWEITDVSSCCPLLSSGSGFGRGQAR